MEEIGELLKDARTTMGLTTQEVAADLKLTETEIINIETGQQDNLKDIHNLKEIVSEYAKYLGLETEEIEDMFNEFVFTYTSKIPLAEIAEASAEIEKENESLKKVVSPYTKQKKQQFPFFRVFIGVVIMLLIIALYFFLQELFF